MNDITSMALLHATRTIDECARHAAIHTVTFITNGATGKIDVKIEGMTSDNEDYEHTFEVSP